MRIPFLLLLLSGGGYTTEPPFVSTHAAVDKFLNIHVDLKYNSVVKHSGITGFTVSFSTEDGEDWRQIELLTSESNYTYQITGTEYGIKQNTGYRIKGCVLFHHGPSTCSELTRVHTRDAAAKPPILHVPEVLINGTAVFSFVPGEDASLISNYSLEYREINELEWRLVQFESDPSSKFLLSSGLSVNETYVARLFVTGEFVSGTPSQEISFDTNNIVELPKITISPSTIIQYDPDLSSSLQIHCSAVCQPPADLKWIVNDQSIHLDHAFYTVTTSVDGFKTTSTISAKSRTRSDTFTCVATNAAGESRAFVKVKIRGPGSPPSSVKVAAESSKFTVSWLPPSQPNGVIRKYVVYYSQNKDEPLSDWMKLELDGTEMSVKLFQEAKESFFVRVQAATDAGPGVISDVVAIERDARPISVSLNYSTYPYNILDPGQNVTVTCVARGKPRPQLSFALSDKRNSVEIETDIWRALSWRLQEDRVVGQLDVSLVSSKHLHCRAKNSVGFNVSSIYLRVKKPGDPPRNVKVASIDSRHISIVWEAPNYPNNDIDYYEVLIFEDSSDSPVSYTTSPREGIDINRLSIRSEEFLPSTEYSCRVRAHNEAGFGPLSELVLFTTANGGPESSPHSLIIEINEANTAVLSWKAPNCTSPVDSYIIYLTRDFGISNEDFHDWQSVEIPSNVTRYRLDHQIGIKQKSLYRVRMTAKNKEAEGPPSAIIEFETAHSSLPIPTEVQAVVNEDNSVTISFPAVRDPEDTAKTIQTYKLEITEGDVPPPFGWYSISSAHILVDETSGLAEIQILPNQLNNSRTYWLRISTILVDSSRTLPSSKPIHLKTGRGKLTTRAVIEGSEQVYKDPSLDDTLFFTCTGEGSPIPSINWLWNGEFIEQGLWRIEEEILSDTKIKSTLSRVGVQASGLITCQTNNNESSSSTSIKLNVVGPGSPPTNIRLIPVSRKNAINVTWGEPKVPNGKILKYVVYFSFENSPNLNDWDRIEVDGKIAQIDVIAPSIPHFFKVQAVNELGYGIISDPVSCTADDSYEPLTMEFQLEDQTSMEVEPNQDIKVKCYGKALPSPRIFLSWLDDSAETEHSVIAKDEEFSAIFAVKTPRNRTIVCRAENKFDNQTRKIDLVVKKPGDIPLNIEWDFDDIGRLLINWTHVKNPNGNTLSYRIYLGHSEVKVAGPPVRWSKEEIPLNVNLDLRISAVNEFGEGTSSPTITVRTPNGGPRDAPRITKVDNIGNNSLILHWTPPKRPQGTIKKYELWWQRLNADLWHQIELDGSQNEFNLGSAVDLGYGEKIRLKLASYNEINNGPTSDIFTVVSWNPFLPTPVNITAILKNSTLYIKFDPDSDAQTFHVDIRGDGHNSKVEIQLVGEMLIIPINETDFFKDSETRLFIQLTSVSPDSLRKSQPSPEIEVHIETPPVRKRRPIKEPPL